MRSPSAGPSAQTPEFDEYTVTLRGALAVEVGGEALVDRTGEGIHLDDRAKVCVTRADRGDRYARGMPAFSPDLVHRDEWSCNDRTARRTLGRRRAISARAASANDPWSR